MQRILIITDNPRAGSPWQHELIRAGYPVATCRSQLDSVREALSPRAPEILILDGTSVRLGPKELIETLRAEYSDHESCVIWLVNEEMASRIDPGCGIDDFIVLPSTAHELLARVRLHLWKRHRVAGDDVIVAGDVVIDQANYAVAVRGQSLNLTFKEYELLKFLVSYRGRVFTREALLNQVWGYDYYGGIRTVDVHIRRIRAKLGADYEDLVETVRNVGYRFSDG